MIRHLLLDRDGVLNVEDPAGGYVTAPEQWRWVDGVLPALAALAGQGLRLSVVTNQSVVGRGGASQAQIDAVHTRMVAEASAVGVGFAQIYVCPHAPDGGCDCRKPAPGLILRALADSGIPAAQTLFVGDATRDLEAGLAAGVHVALVRTGKGRRSEATWSGPSVPVYDDLGALARVILQADGEESGG